MNGDATAARSKLIHATFSATEGQMLCLKCLPGADKGIPFVF